MSEQSQQCPVDRYYQAWNEGNISAMADLFEPNLKFRGPMQQHDSARDFIASCEAMSKDPAFKAMKVNGLTKIAQGHEVVSLYEVGTGKKQVPMAEYFKVSNNGKIAEMRLYFDPKLFQ